MMQLIDILRQRFPSFGFALYAYDPAGRVTFEMHEAGYVHTFTGATAEDAILQAFPTQTARIALGLVPAPDAATPETPAQEEADVFA